MLQGPASKSSGRGALIAAPMVGGGRLLGVIALTARASRPIGRSELLLLQAFANRVGEVLLAGGDVGPPPGAGDAALSGLVVERAADRLTGGRPAPEGCGGEPAASRLQISVSASAFSEASSSRSIGATPSTAHSSSTRRIGAPSGTTRRRAWRRAASRRPRSKSRWMPELSR